MKIELAVVADKEAVAIPKIRVHSPHPKNDKANAGDDKVQDE